MEPRKFVQRIIIAGAGVLTIICGVDGAGLIGEADADTPDCVANATYCPGHPNLVRADPSPAHHIQTFCHPAGRAGQHCFQRWVP